MAMTSTGAMKFMVSWWDELKSRPFDTPRFTAVKGTPSIVIYLSANAIPSPTDLEHLLKAGPAWLWYLTAFVDGPYPILRSSLKMPDNPRDPYVFESPLDIRSGDVQDFCVAAATNESIDIILGHQMFPLREHAAVSFDAPGLRPLVRGQFERARSHLRDDATEDHFQASIELLEQTYASPAVGLDRRNAIRLSVAGEAQNAFLDYQF
jgi:hypothetical protein